MRGAGGGRSAWLCLRISGDPQADPHPGQALVCTTARIAVELLGFRRGLTWLDHVEASGEHGIG